MTSLTSQSETLNKYLRRTVRAWWADGLWDLAMAGFLAVTAMWLYPLIRAVAFPSWTWPWPFTTQETIYPMHAEIIVWAMATLVIWSGYVYLAYRVVSWLKRRFVASRLGDVRFNFMLPIENRAIAVYVALYLLGSVLVMALLAWLKDGPRLAAALCIVAPASLLFVLGKTYALARYRWVAGLGLGLSLLAEFFTTTAVYHQGPTNFMDVSPIVGNPSLPLLVWAGVLLVSGAFAFYQTMRLPHVSQ
ncbi:MAG: hypothetical protein IPM53_19830 [Anaerolineaceae bacterium]|nr:hypothetical protein [Anaerolineaceae bacterium]